MMPIKRPRNVVISSYLGSTINSLLGLELTNNDVETELSRLDFPYTLKNDEFTVTIPRRRLDIDENVNDIAEEIGRLYGYHNLVSTLPKVGIRKGRYIGDVKYRKLVTKRLRSLGLNEVKTYTLTSPEMANTFKYEDRSQERCKKVWKKVFGVDGYGIMGVGGE